MAKFTLSVYVRLSDTVCEHIKAVQARWQILLRGCRNKKAQLMQRKSVTPVHVHRRNVNQLKPVRLALLWYAAKCVWQTDMHRHTRASTIAKTCLTLCAVVRKKSVTVCQRNSARYFYRPRCSWLGAAMHKKTWPGHMLARTMAACQC